MIKCRPVLRSRPGKAVYSYNSAERKKKKKKEETAIIREEMYDK